MSERNEAELRARGNKLWAVYASFPTRAGEPDEAELLASPFPVATYLAISLNTKGVLEMRACIPVRWAGGVGARGPGLSGAVAADES